MSRRAYGASRPRRRVAFTLASGLVLCLAIWAGPVIESAAPQEGPPPTGTASPAKPPAVHQVGGVRQGPSFFPLSNYPETRPLKPGEVDFKHYHTVEETVSLLKAWAKAYPDLVDLYSVGQSFEGREIWQVTITNKKTGKDTDKPAFFLEGGRHAGEISGIETTLYFINHVLTGYGADPALTKLVDSRALYVRSEQRS